MIGGAAPVALFFIGDFFWEVGSGKWGVGSGE